METVLIAGGSGLIGKALTKELLALGYKVTWLSRNTSGFAPVPVFGWDVNSAVIDPDAIEGCNYIINLAGSSIAAKRWSKNRKKNLLESRINSTHLLVNSINDINPNVKAFISSSAIGYYGAVTLPGKHFTENDFAGNDFLANCCKSWEEETTKLKTNTRRVILRFGMVLSSHGGALKKIAFPFKLGIGSALGNGNQIMPWIHIDDLVNIISSSITNVDMSGVYNAVAPEIISNYHFSKSLAETLHKPFFMPNIPAVILKLTLGEMADLLLEGSSISSEKLENTGYEFKFKSVKRALANIYR